MKIDSEEYKGFLLVGLKDGKDTDGFILKVGYMLRLGERNDGGKLSSTREAINQGKEIVDFMLQKFGG